MAGPLSHLRVLDLSRVLAGPWCAQTLADLGAEVVKVERPGSGDDTRTWGPPWAKTPDGEPTRESAYYLCVNRGKRSVTIDFERPEGRDLVLRLAETSDVLIENYKVGGLRKYGLDWEAVRKVNPRLVYCSITGFGQTGPYAQRAGYDFIVQGMGGLMSVTGMPAGTPGGEPVKVGVAVADLFTGMYATVAVLAALAHRDRTGEGQHIDLALLDAQVAMMSSQAMNYLVGGRVPGRQGNGHPNIVPYQALPASDGQIILAIGNDGQFARFCEIAGRPDVAKDPRFATNPARVANRDALIGILEDITRTRSAKAWVDSLSNAGVPCGPINDLAGVFADPQVQARGMRRDLPHPVAGTVPTVANPIRYSATPIVHDKAPPLLGADTDEVLAERLGLTMEQIAALRDVGVV
ncbi:MAG TPA: CaiB/BaiF CoA-transferase family protein [Azospirillaceae bacterium]|nr:CaiB/BaiF CoA-transferase family protein [Azospirillaceae bacterium]